MFTNPMSYADEVYDHLKDGPLSGRELCARLNAGRYWFWQWSAPSFYYMMARLEEEGVVYHYEAESICGPVRIRTHMYGSVPGWGR